MKSLITLILIGAGYFAFSQDQITMYKSSFGLKFVVTGQDSGKYNPAKPMKSLLEITGRYPKSYEYFKKGKNQYTASTVLGMIGGFCVGYPLGGVLSGNDMNWAMFGIGAGIVAVSLPIAISGSKNLDKGIAIYNGKGELANAHSVMFNYGLSAKGLSLQIDF